MENMENVMTGINVAFLIASSAFIAMIVISSVAEKEWRAVWLSLLGMAGNTAMWSVFIMMKEIDLIRAITIGTIAFLCLFGLVSLIRFFPKRQTRDTSAIEPFDERDHMFSRNNLQFHPQLAERYYAGHAEKLRIDREIQQKKELGEPGQTYYDVLCSTAVDAAFTYLGRGRHLSRGHVAEKRMAIDSRALTDTIKTIGRFHGAVDVGIARLQTHHLYTHTGRHAENWGVKVENEHSFAVAVVVAMDTEMMREAPTISEILESSRQYVEAGKIANIIAEFLRLLGYDARAHTDGNYETLCVPIAVDSGIGELGRMGLFMHREYGPCVRLSIVTTEAELIAAETKPLYIEEFCVICKKCADNCPTQSISHGDEPESRGCRHWSVNQETCYTFWKNAGTDCGICIRSCPYTKPNTLMHKLVRFYISRNPLNQRIALFFDDLLYGRKVKIRSKNAANPWTHFQ